MIGDSGVNVMVFVIYTALVFKLGGLAGLYCAWSQPARMQRWADGVHRFQSSLNERLD